MKIVKIKCHIKKKEPNPYPKYSYNSGLIEQYNTYHKDTYGLDSNWLIWQIKHGGDIISEDI